MNKQDKRLRSVRAAHLAAARQDPAREGAGADDLAAAWQTLLAEPASPTHLRSVLGKLYALGARGAAGLARLSEFGRSLQTATDAAEAEPAASLPERLLQQMEGALVAALAAAGADAPTALEALHQQAICPVLRDCACEAASQLGQRKRHPALLRLQLAHLQSNPAVAALALAEYGDPASEPYLRKKLRAELGAPGPTSTTAIVALEEALATLACTAPPVPDFAPHKNQAGKMKAVAGWLHRLEAATPTAAKTNR